MTPLWCKSNFSFLEGASHPHELIETCAALGLTGLALTDRDGVYGLVEAHLRARELGVQLIAGAEVSIDDGSTLVLLAENRAGYANLCRLLTLGHGRCAKGESRVGWREVCEHAGDLIALWGGERALLAGEAEPFFVAHPLREAFGERLYALAARHRRADEPAREARLRRRAARYGLPIVAASEVLYHRPQRRELQDVLTCLRQRVRLAEAGRRLRANAEHALRTPAAFARLFADDPDAVARTGEIAARCRFGLAELRYRYPSEALPDGTTSAERLRRLTLEGARRRYGGAPPAEVAGQLAKELALIDELDYCGYFLTMWEIVQFCHRARILCQGRGSAANSAVCYCLGITAVDPVRLGLLFERFLSRERAEPPDIDLDIEHARREEVIQHVFAKYGRTHAAMVANVVRYRPRSALRDVGRVLGVPETALDRLAKQVPHRGEAVTGEMLGEAGLDPQAPLHRHLARLATAVLDFPRHLSIHPGGFLLGHEPVATLVPIEKGAMPGRTIIQWDKDSLEALGLFKVDLLGLGALHQLHLGLDLLRAHYRLELGLADIPPEDPATFAMIRAADTIGTFQIESRAQMAMLPRLKPRCYYDLVIEVSLVRPGPITGGMVHPYLRRRAGREPIVYPHPSLEPVLAKTLGVPLFQEQVIRLAMVAADYSPGEADQLRRDMAAWRQGGRIERHRGRLIGRMTAKGIDPAFAAQVFEQIRGFGEYGFPESHAASFALIAYATAWLKCHHPDVFACALLNAQPMGFYAPATIIEDAKRHGTAVRPVDVVQSDWDCTLEPTDDASPQLAIRMGGRYVKGVGRTDWTRLAEARAAKPFASIDDLARRTDLDAGALERLAEAGALRSLVDDRRTALWQAAVAAHDARPPLELTPREPPVRFAALDVGETICWDHRTSAHSTLAHPLAPLRAQLRARGLPDSAQVRAMRDGQRTRYAGLVICRQCPATAAGVLFMTLEDEQGLVNAVVWQRLLKRQRRLIRGMNFLGVSGRIQLQEGVLHLIAESFWDPQSLIATRPAATPSRDFH
ncbi:DNA-directed DNA polymerase III PolC [Thioflavicoccus mobilis 8321]|uniref:Error-prone DNA polymerase n=1 Tax=Thioflavicoccus mobilis 8321 TaxID=765912 RepID=L0GX43_9GAMM|nr:error-prone DNA polymerase [Thioflavicoccus mobilis]AGA90397.1 DNA-directed DNA polymerase III PolC [Thioflavicoccus mobilis 8321]